VNCPHCGEECWRESVHNGVGLMHGPWGCPDCGWSEYPEYDCREGTRMDGADRVFDQYGISHHVTRLDGLAVLYGFHVASKEPS